MIQFVKAHACGNDFLVVQKQEIRDGDFAAAARKLCHRNRGIGADGVEFLSSVSRAEAQLDLFNADGSAAEISGNGTRCAAAWLAWQGDLGAGDQVALTTGAGIRVCTIRSREGHHFEMTSPMAIEQIHKSSVQLGDLLIEGASVSTGNPHFVVFVEDAGFSLCGRDWKSLGAEISAHPSFPGQTNVEFVRCQSQEAIEIRIFERGAGPTTSSGTGTCAAAAAAIRLRHCTSKLDVIAPGGRQSIVWKSESSGMLLTGPAELICTGQAFD